MSLNLFLPDAGAIAPPTTTTLASSGGLLINIDSAIGTLTTATTGQRPAVEDEKFGIFIRSTGTNVGTSSGQFVTGAGGTGSRVFRYGISGLTNVGGTFCRAANIALSSDTAITVSDMMKFHFPVKPSTKYKLRIRFNVTSFTTVGTTPGFACGIDTYNSSGTKVRTSATSGAAYTASTGGFIWETLEFTSGATETYIGWNFYCISGNGSIDIDYNAWKLDEVIEPVANSLTSSSPSLVSFTAVGSVDNIDQSLDVTGAYANTYTLTTAVNEGATHKQTFVPKKSKETRIGVWVVAKGTGNWTLTIHDASNVTQSTQTIANASLTNGAFNYFTIPANLTAGGTYHFHLFSTVADGTVKCNTAGDLETCSYIENYYKPTTNFKVSQNNQSVSISADEDGFLNTGVYNISTGTYNFTHTNDTTLAMGSSYSLVPNLYSYSTTTAGATSDSLYRATNTISLHAAIAGTSIATYKIDMSILSSVRWAGCVRYAMAEYSYDNSAWNTINDNRSTTTEIAVDTTITKSGNYIYLRFTSGAAANSSYIGSTTNPFIITGVIDTSSLSTLRNYPTNKDIIKQYSTTLGSATTSATYRATKWGFPAIEYSATEYQFLDVDTTASGSSVAFSELGTSYTTLADGASLAITSTSTPSIFVKANITANRLYLSSNDYSASSDKDGSLKQSVVYQVKSISTQSRNTKLSNRNASLKLTYG